MIERVFVGPAQLAEELAQSVAQSLREGILERDAASLVVSGGTTPLPFFEALRGQELPWRKVCITLADERWVSPDDERSNERFVRRNLLLEGAGEARLVGLKTDHSTPEEGQVACHRRLENFQGLLDVVVLGMGTDGHFASLFPAAEGLEQGLDPAALTSCVAVRPGGVEPRMSLTLRRITDSRRVVLHIVGEEKLALLRTTVREARDELPIYWLVQSVPRLEVFWAA